MLTHGITQKVATKGTHWGGSMRKPLRKRETKEMGGRNAETITPKEIQKGNTRR